ncbi:MAG: hypothetical protein RIG62_26475 [Cyclobacteriaceae bacterium]
MFNLKKIVNVPDPSEDPKPEKPDILSGAVTQSTDPKPKVPRPKEE